MTLQHEFRQGFCQATGRQPTPTEMYSGLELTRLCGADTDLTAYDLGRRFGEDLQAEREE